MSSILSEVLKDGKGAENGRDRCSRSPTALAKVAAGEFTNMTGNGAGKPSAWGITFLSYRQRDGAESSTIAYLIVIDRGVTQKSHSTKAISESKLFPVIGTRSYR